MNVCGYLFCKPKLLMFVCFLVCVSSKSECVSSVCATWLFGHSETMITEKPEALIKPRPWMLLCI